MYLFKCKKKKVTSNKLGIFGLHAHERGDGEESNYTTKSCF